MTEPLSSRTPASTVLNYLLDQATEHALIFLDVQGHITHWLAGAETIFGYAPNEVLGQYFSMLFTPEDVQAGAPEKEIKIALAGSPAEDDRWMLRKDGLRFWATGVLQAVGTGDQSVIGFAKILRNRTDLKTQLESLENEVRGLKRADERKNSFISTLSHELRSPLSAVTIATELLENVVDESAEEAIFAIATLQRQAASMRRLVDDLLDLTRISVGKISLDLQEIALADVLHAALDACGPVIADRPDDFHFIFGEKPIIVRADAQRLQQVFINLIQNAAKYTDRGGDIWVKVLIEGQDAVVKVEDTGIGISAELLPRIFDLFTQAEFTSEAGRSGLGIGLSVVQDITRLHGGSVTVRSDGVGKGSEFNVRLPLAGPDRNRPDSPAPRN